ncbi:hypothetical protein [Aurantiacibacter spongiae]|uniref:Uncharacterized protein n=1 Tax=Aurantiacibacter spongiae TaxID=2488860 RepID=A0A3N5CV03_9SPHN|nr:hypothetical protein [Aurantiacibacter spongiae]RPF70449.1 hypothetical protein EG799_01500 [Aurantiacibacter spongiae]
MSNKTDTAEQEAAVAAGLPKVSQSEIDKAKKEGALEAAKEQAKDSYRYATDGNLPGETTGPKYPGSSDIMQFAPILDLDIDAFKDRVKEGSDDPVPEEKVAGLLELERSGQNRTDYVKALCKRLDVDSPYEVTTAGPGYTNDVSPITKL